jgi:hypothetical protein
MPSTKYVTYIQVSLRVTKPIDEQRLHAEYFETQLWLSFSPDFVQSIKVTIRYYLASLPVLTRQNHTPELQMRPTISMFPCCKDPDSWHD